jgi:hypothetical protein
MSQAIGGAPLSGSKLRKKEMNASCNASSATAALPVLLRAIRSR